MLAAHGRRSPRRQQDPSRAPPRDRGRRRHVGRPGAGLPQRSRVRQLLVQAAERGRVQLRRNRDRSAGLLCQAAALLRRDWRQRDLAGVVPVPPHAAQAARGAYGSDMKRWAVAAGLLALLGAAGAFGVGMGMRKMAGAGPLPQELPTLNGVEVMKGGPAPAPPQAASAAVPAPVSPESLPRAVTFHQTTTYNGAVVYVPDGCQ